MKNYLLNINSYVSSKAPETIYSLINQRLRYASKSLNYYRLNFVSKELKLIMPFIYVVNLITALSIIILCNNPNIKTLLLVMIKFFSDFMLIFIFINKTNYKIRYILFLLISFLHPFYILIFSTIGPFKKVKWKIDS